MKELKFNSQICTTREQSQRLLDLGLNPETADMNWTIKDEDREGNEYSVEYRSIGRGTYHSLHPNWYIPAWSMHRLIEMCNKTQFGMTISVYNNEVTVDGDLFELSDNTYDNLISVIEWLIKGGHFKKEYLKQ